jgi:hypothetical protein
MKCFLIAAVIAAAAAQAQYDTCVSSGDPHYTPFSGRGDRFTVMGMGEHKLVDYDNFGVHSCQKDVSFSTRQPADGKWNKEGKLTWNTDIVTWEDDVTVEILLDGTVKMTDQTDSTNAWRTTRKGFTIFKTNKVHVQRVSHRSTKRITVRWATGKMVEVTYLHRNTKKFGNRKATNVVIKHPKGQHTAEGTGLCYEKKSTAGRKGHKQTESKFSSVCTAGQTLTIDFEINAQIEALLTVCPQQIAAAYSACGPEDPGCVFDIVAGCTKDAITADERREQAEEQADAQVEQEEIAEVSKDYTCPVNSYVNTKEWPLSGFDDCACTWGYQKNADGDACEPVAAPTDTVLGKDNSLKNHPNMENCFCDPASINHCMQVNDNSCRLPVMINEQGKDCNDPKNAFDRSQCVCEQSTMDCTRADYSLVEIQAPGLAVPKQPFGQQPIFALYDGAKVTESTKGYKLRVSIANVQSEACGSCTGDKVCLHNNKFDNTCFAKQELFGDMVCPAGTTECVPEQAEVDLYRVDPNDPSVEVNDKQCTNERDTNKGYKNYCSDETPCKQQNDGTCMPKQTWQRNELTTEAAAPVEKCHATTNWRLAEPSPVRNWHFVTDASCDMQDSTKGCTEAGDSYAMDKWCDHNCRPEAYGRIGQPGFCPASHCTCSTTAVTVEEKPAKGWRCPLESYADGSCFCSAGTEHCGAIEFDSHKGVVQFKHLTIGLPGKYTLLVELVKADQRTGSSMSLSAQSSVFEVRYPSQGEAECRAQSQWRVDDLPNSEVHGAGKSWFFEDGTLRCTERNADSTCAKVKKMYAMDKWCKANRCLPHTLERHCEVKATAAFPPVGKCPNEVYDNFGDCCDSGIVDQCNVCDGDGSTCNVQHYLNTFAKPSDVEAALNLPAKECPITSPCAHDNVGDYSCTPKTYNSQEKVNDEFHYCPYVGEDGKDMEGVEQDDAVWRKGSWDGPAGKASIQFGTLEAKGNKDCFCPDGTTDMTARAKIADQMVKDFKETVTEKIKEVRTLVTDEKVDTKMTNDMKIVEKTKDNEIKLYDTECPDGTIKATAKMITIKSGCKTSLHAMRWAKGVAFKSSPVKCIKLPAGVGINTWKTDKISPEPDQEDKKLEDKKLPKVFNDKKEDKVINIPATDDRRNMASVQGTGNIFKAFVNILGSTVTCVKRECGGKLAGACDKDSACKKAMQEAENCGKKGGLALPCMRLAGARFAAKSKAFKDMLTCSARSQCLKAGASATKVAVKSTVTKFFSAFKKPSFFGRRRLVAAGAVTASSEILGRVTTAGNTGLPGQASNSGSSLAAPAKTATGKYATGYGKIPAGNTSAGASGGLSSAATALISVGAIAAVFGAAIGAKKYRDGQAQLPTSSTEMAKTATTEDTTDVL